MQRKVNKRNMTGIPNILYYKTRKSWVYEKMINRKRILKYFRTKDKAIEYKNVFEKSIYKASIPFILN
jgi:hypothetical protein